MQSVYKKLPDLENYRNHVIFVYSFKATFDSFFNSNFVLLFHMNGLTDVLLVSGSVLI